MSPFTHLLGSWIIAAKTTDNLRDTRLVALAGLLPDADGAGILVDMIKDPSLSNGAFYYQEYHHFLAHGILGGLVISTLLTFFARRRWRVFLMCLVAFHVHLVCDFVGSRGPAVIDLWPIYYFGPIARNPMWIWGHQWALDGWQNRIIELTLFVCAMWMAVKRGDSFFGVFNRRLDALFTGVLRGWKGRFDVRKGGVESEKLN